MSDDPRIVYSARCSWWDSIDKTAKTSSGLPCCPNCHSVLFEIENIEAWWTAVDHFEKSSHKGYRKFVEWLRGKCYTSMEAALTIYKKSTGEGVENL